MSVNIRVGLQPGDLGYITYLHGKIYADEYGFDTSFEPYVTRPMSEFSLSDNHRQRIWVAEKDDKVVGSIAIVDAGDNMAQLRWLILISDVRGMGLGRKLVGLALDFCRAEGYDGVFLWTVSILEAAAFLYRSYGFDVSEEKTHQLWGKVLTEQRYDLKL